MCSTRFFLKKKKVKRLNTDYEQWRIFVFNFTRFSRYLPATTGTPAAGGEKRRLFLIKLTNIAIEFCFLNRRRTPSGAARLITFNVSL